jgi:flagellar assembly protein FliH
VAAGVFAPDCGGRTEAHHANSMLSKVLGRGHTSTAQPLVFPDLAGHDPGADLESRNRRAGDEGNDDSAGLRAKLHELESRAASERRDAFEKGKRQGEQQARAELQPVLERLHASVIEVLGMRPDLRRRAERDVVQLALLIAKRVLHRQLSVDEEALTAIASVAFERLTRSESYRVTVNPQFAAAVTSALSGIRSARVHIDPDPNCALGTLIIHSAEGTIDASVDTQLEEISRGLTDRLISA